MTKELAEQLDAPAIQNIFDRSPFIRFLGLQVLALDHAKGTLSSRMPLREELKRGGEEKRFHGGPIASFIDIVGDFAVGMALGGGVPTVNLRIDYLRPAIGDFVDATATVRRVGKTSAVVDIDVFGQDGKLIAVGRGSYLPQRR
jgi:uncharacterized protein (TIGR00369 family)